MNLSSQWLAKWLQRPSSTDNTEFDFLSEGRETEKMKASEVFEPHTHEMPQCRNEQRSSRH